MKNKIHSILQHIITPENGKFLTVITLLLVFAFIPLTVYLSSQEQDLRQEAAKKKNVKKGKKARKNNQKQTKKKKKQVAKKKAVKKGRIVKARTVTPRPITTARQDVPGVILVKLKATAETSSTGRTTEENIRSRHKGRQKKRLSRTRWREVEVPKGKEDQIIAELKKDPNVESVEQDAYASVLTSPDDEFFTQQWGFNNTGQVFKNRDLEDTQGSPNADADILQAWSKTQGKEDVVVAVLDTGIDADHPDLAGKVIQAGTVFSDSDTEDDVFGHGTHVAGVIAANTNNTYGIAGTCPKCKVANIKVMDDEGEGLVSNIAAGVEKAIDMRVDVINLSVGTAEDLQILRDAVNAAWNAGILVVAASGNQGKNESLYPAAYPTVISVGATDANDNRPNYSNYGSTVDVAAPGDAILSTFKGGDYAIMNGTSMASPMVAGVAGLLFSTPEYGGSAQSVRNRIEQTTDKTGDEGRFWQFGRINAARALSASQSSITPPSNPTPGTSVTPTGATPSLTPTNNPLSAMLQLNVFVVGVGRVGDRESSGVPGNQNPVTKEREFIVEILDSNNKPVQKAKKTLPYIPILGGYSGAVPVNNIPAGQYLVNIYSVGTLKKQASGIFNLSQTKITKVPNTTLITGDITGDNAIDILDFNVLAGCYSVTAKAKSCTDTKKKASDLNDDGLVNGFDYNLLIRNIAVLRGS